MPVADFFNRHGINALVLRYRLLPNYSPQDAIDDLTAAVKFVRRCCKGPVAALGFSAGGHLVASHALHRGSETKKSNDLRTDVDAQILIYPGIDPKDWKHPDKCGFYDYDKCFAHVPALLKNGSELLGGRGFSAPPTFIVSSTKDEVCPANKHGDPYVKALRRRRIPYVYMRGNFGGHGFGLGRGWTDSCIAWLHKRGFGPKCQYIHHLEAKGMGPSGHIHRRED